MRLQSGGAWRALLRQERYRRHFLRDDARQSSIALGAVALGYAAVAPNDFVIVQSGPLRMLALVCRGAFAAITAVAVVLLLRCRSGRDLDRAHGLLGVGILVILVGGHLTRIPSGHIVGTLFGALAWVVLLFLATRGSLLWRAVLVAAMAVSSIVTALLPWAKIDPPARLAFLVALLITCLIGATSARWFEENRRERFETGRRARHARQELAAAKERAEAAARARAAFLAAMSHEFRTPMNAVIGLSSLLAETPFGPDHRAHARTIHESARALLVMLEDILDFAAIDAQKLTLSPAPFDLAKLVASIGDMLRPDAAARGLTLIADVAPDLPEAVVADDARLRQVLVNLVANAIKFTERGTVTLRVSARACDEGDYAIGFRVEDTGIGMSPALLTRAFSPFEQGESARRRGGTGLGLAIAKRIVAAMGGELRAESAPGRGSVLSFSLRLRAAEAPVRISEPSPSARGLRSQLAVLVVDDHPVNREVARALLDRFGCAADLAHDGEGAIAAAQSRDYDLILMDLHLPDMSGIEATARIAGAVAASPRVVAMTASLLEDDRQACRRAGMSGFLGKPIDVTALGALLRSVAEERGVARPPAAPREPISERSFSRLKHLGSPRFVESLCCIFVAEAHRRLARMRDALARGDAQAIAREVHPLRSSSASLGARDLSAVCGNVESAARAGRIEELGAGIEAIAARVIEVERSLSQDASGGRT